ncbi:metalloregulator ArsR/SmtB family transcription factor [Rapidithrix thailandica]|uniref:Metalloregulator ArsR/SmtB family transcription factor n=1 Tax=Rapidithrix thailandica TaxID=413964 RepID=A0AAW9SEE0_9BACT
MEFSKIKKISKALSDDNRLKILLAIRKKASCLQCTEIYDMVQLTQPSISHHMKQLIEADLVLYSKEGRNVKYNLNKKVLNEYIAFLEELKES